MHILFIGDTVASAGRAIVKHYLKNLQEQFKVGYAPQPSGAAQNRSGR